MPLRRRLTRSLLTGATLLLSLASASAQAPAQPPTQPGSELATQRATHLRRGINTSNWFAQALGRYTTDRLRSFTTPDDLALIHRLGFDHIRLSVDADPLTAWVAGKPEGQTFVTELDRVIAQANAQGLAVIVDLHPEGRYKQSLLQGSDGVRALETLWHALAGHLASTDPALVFFEIMNEPEQTDIYRWVGIEAKALAAIRSAAPQHTVIATGAQWSGLEDLLQTEPLADPDVIYTFHDYEPFAFTHQGATWTDARVRPLRGVPYPSTPDNVAPNEAQEPTLDGQLFVLNYGLDRWNSDRVSRTVALAARWGQQHHVPVYCGEFGVHRPYAPPADRAAWLHDMRSALEINGIGWAMWDYQDNFGLVTKSNGQTTPDPLLIKALGLSSGQ